MTGKRLVITGGTGTLGRCLIRRALAPGQPWTSVRSLSRHEIKVAQLDEEFRKAAPFKAMLGDVRDRQSLALAFRGVDTVVHAAALKRVDVGAYSPRDIIATNIVGTMNVVDAAIHAGVRRVVVISSDKSVAPVNLYGASKNVAETYAVQANVYGVPSGTRISAVRYGNVLGSTGSVVGIWRAQALAGEPLTVTHPGMTRFVMTIEQACQLVEFALSRMRGGEVYVPLLPSARMTDLAQAVADTVLGSIDGVDCKLSFTSLRPGGEKVAEALLNQEEPSRTVRVSPYYLAVLPTHHEWTTRPWPGELLPAGFEYRSDGAEEFLTRAALRAMLDGTEAGK